MPLESCLAYHEYWNPAVALARPVPPQQVVQRQEEVAVLCQRPESPLPPSSSSSLSSKPIDLYVRYTLSERRETNKPRLATPPADDDNTKSSLLSGTHMGAGKSQVAVAVGRTAGRAVGVAGHMDSACNVGVGMGSLVAEAAVGG